MNLIQRLWQYISLQGVNQEEPLILQRRVRALNQMAVIVAALLILYGLINIFNSELFIASTQLVLMPIKKH